MARFCGHTRPRGIYSSPKLEAKTSCRILGIVFGWRIDRQKPSSVRQYKEWLAKEHSCDLDRVARYYESVTTKAKADLEGDPFWIELKRELIEFNDRYRLETGFPLHMSGHSLELSIKPFDSFFHKTFRKNILQNRHWPEAPDGGWFIPSSCFSRVSDILRTLLVVKYMDGVQFVVDSMESFCKTKGPPFRKHFEARQDGYYAAHSYISRSFEVPRMTWDSERIDLSIEIQITTQLQETIRQLLHKYYEDRRERPTQERWEWDYRSDEFAANYLGHILHYVEGMIMEIREKQYRGRL